MLSLRKTGHESTKKKKVMFSSRSKKSKKKMEDQDLEAAELTKQINSAQGIEIIKKMNQLHIKNQISKFYHTNFAGYLDKETVSKEQWEQKAAEKKDEIDLVTYRNNFEIFFSLNTTIAFTLTIWLANVQFFFGSNQQSFISSDFYILPMIAVIFDLILSGELKKIISNFSLKQSLPQLLKLALCLIYLSLKINEISISQQAAWLLLQIPCIYIFYMRASQLYKSFRVMSLSKSYQYHFKAFDLIFSLVIVAHLIAIILFQVAIHQNQPITWVTELHISHENALIKYIYSFYFGCTTILTVGYGDITPQNHIQVLVVSFVQIFGVAIFGYLLSEIGYNLSILRKDREALEKDLAVLDKCRHYYKIQPDLVVKARSKLLNSQKSSDRLKPQEQKELMMKFNEPLRQQLITSNALSVIKSSVFFICRWSRYFQSTLAQSLNTALYTPGEEFLQTPGKQRIYIIRLGKVDFYRKKKGNNQESRKVIQSLKIQLNTEVSNNSFGYTAVLGTKETGLQVISRDFTSAYFVEKQVFQNLTKESNEDWEYYFEIKDKIEQSRFPESLQVPVLSSRKYHYNPSRLYLIKKNQKEIQQFANERSQFKRSDFRRATKVKAAELVDIPSEQMTQIRKMIITSYDDLSLKSIKSLKSVKEPKSLRSIKSLTSIASLKSLKDQSQKSIDSQKALPLEKAEPSAKQKIEAEDRHLSLEAKLPKVSTKRHSEVVFDRSKQYLNFYPRQNCSVIFQKLERSNFSYLRLQVQEEDQSRTLRIDPPISLRF